MRRSAASRATASGSRPRVEAPSERSTIAAGGRAAPARPSTRRSEAASASPVAVRPYARGAERLTHRLAVGAGRPHPRIAPVKARADPDAVGRAVEEPLRRVAGGGEPRRLDVRRPHRARHVGRQHHRRLPARHRHGALGPRQREAETGESERVQGDGDVAAPARAARSTDGIVAGVAKAAGPAALDRGSGRGVPRAAPARAERASQALRRTARCSWPAAGRALAERHVELDDAARRAPPSTSTSRRACGRRSPAACRPGREPCAPRST